MKASVSTRSSSSSKLVHHISTTNLNRYSLFFAGYQDYETLPSTTDLNLPYEFLWHHFLKQF